MSKSMHLTPALTYLIGLSFFGLLLAGMLSLYPPVTRESFVWRKPLIGTVFGVICILGILAVFFPKRCSGIMDFVTKGKREDSAVDRFAFHGASSTMKGHHPDCENFSHHVFQIFNGTFCTACTGLLLGGLTAFAGTFLYFFRDLHIEQNSLLLVWIGILGVGFGLFQVVARRTLVRLFLNTFFVLGSFLILMGIDELAQNVFADIFLILLAVFWLYTRIMISEWDHRMICYACNSSSCEFRKFRKNKS